MDTFYTADPHAGHPLMAKLRGFGNDVAAHDEALITSWNKAVRPRDRVILGGDAFLGGQQNIALFGKLHGRKILVAGNHDRVHPSRKNWHDHLPAWLEYFDIITTLMRTEVGGIPALVSHFPRAGTREEHGAGRFMSWRPPAGDIFLLHGHTHSQGIAGVTEEGVPIRNQVHIGWDAWGQPVPEEQLAVIMRNMEGEHTGSGEIPRRA